MKKMDKRLRRLIVLAAVIVTIATIIGALFAVDKIITSGKAKEISVEEAQTLVDTTFDDLPVNIAEGALKIRENTVITVNSVEARKNKELRDIVAELGVSRELNPFMNMAFSALSVIPHLKMTTFGLVDVDKQKIVPLYV